MKLLRKSPISLMKNKSIDEITANSGKTFAQMRAEIDEGVLIFS